MATILHIDPDEVAQKFIRATLGHQYNVVSATDGPTAIQYCAMIQPDLIVMDLDLPDTNGHELTSRLKMFMPQTPILVTAAPNGGQLQQPVAGSDGLLTKPINENKLWHTINSLLPQPATLPQFVTKTGLLTNEVVEQFEAQIDALNQANKRLASLNSVSALVGTSLDLEHLTDEVLRQIQKTVDFDSATLFLLKGNILEAAASRGLSDYRRGLNVYTKSEHNSAWQVVNNKLPLIINDVTQSEYWEPRPELGQVRSWLGVPLVYKDRVVGVLTLDKNEPDAFIDADARYVFTLAYQIAIAVENAQLFEEWEDQATRLKLINEVGQEITTILDVNHLFDTLAWAIFERLYYDRVAIFEVEQPTGIFALRAYYDKSSPKLNADNYPPNINKNKEPIKQVIETGRPVLLKATASETDPGYLADQEMQSGLVIPVFVDNIVEAVISVYSRSGLGDQDLWTLSSLASQAATVIENAQLYQNIDAYSARLERTVVARTQRLQAIKKVSRVVSQGLDVNELLAVVGQEIGQIFTPEDSDGDSANVFIGLRKGSNLAVRTINKVVGTGGQDDIPLLLDKMQETTYKINAQTPAGQVIDHARPMMLSNVNPQSIYNAEATTAQEEFVNSVIIAPLITAGKTIGIIMVENRQANAFDDSDLETLESVAVQVATAVEQARLLQKTRELAIVDERTRLARDMHDGVAQNLAYLLIQVDRCLNLVEEDSKLESHLELISSVLKQNIEELRRNIFDLRPVDLEGKPLFEVLENFVTEFGRRWNLKTHCSIEGQSGEVPREIESSLYRVLQETLSNARKHAHCSQLWVNLAIKDNEAVTLEIKDDGQGFEIGVAGQHLQRYQDKGLGLISMRERTESLGGQLTIESQPGQGTRIFAVLPLYTATNDGD